MRYNLSLKELTDTLEYDEGDKTFVFKWKPRMIGRKGGGTIPNTQFAGKRAGCKTKQGYTHVTIAGTIFKVHRLVYMLKESIPFSDDLPDEVDHKNRDVTDNRMSNLRDGSSTESIGVNSRNRQNIGKSRYIGVCITDKLRGKFSTTIGINFHEIGLAYYETETYCAEVYKASCKYLGYEVDSCYDNIKDITLPEKVVSRIEKGLAKPVKEKKTSRFKGVIWSVQRQAFVARISLYINNKNSPKTVGYFQDDYEASVRRDLLIIEKGYTNPLVSIRKEDYDKYRTLFPKLKVKKVQVTCPETGEVTLYGGPTPVADTLHLCKKTLVSILNKERENKYRWDFEWVYVDKEQ